MTLKVRILHIFTTFTQVTAILKNFLVGWGLVLGLKEGLVECATVCVKSWVILKKVAELDSGLEVTCRKELRRVEEMEKDKDKDDQEKMRNLF